MVGLREPVAIVAVSQAPSVAVYPDSEPSMVMDVVNDLIGQTGLDRHDIDFTIAGSCDYLSGMPFAFIANIDGVGAWPPVYESHVEMDGAWALFEAVVRLQLGDIDLALVSGSGKSSPGRHREVFPLQTDPYIGAPLGIDPVSMAGIQARMLIDAGLASERSFAEVVARCRHAAAANPNAQIRQPISADDAIAAPYVSSPLREHDLPPYSDGAAALILARGDRARELCANPVWVAGIDHRIESHHPGLRDLTQSVSTEIAARNLGVTDGPIDVAELSTAYSHEEGIVRRAIGLADDVNVNPSGGPLCGNPLMATGLVRVIEVASRIMHGDAERGVAHATSGAALQQNLLCVLEGGK